MKGRELLLKEAQENFPSAVSEVEAVDNLARKIYIELSAMKDKESERYFKLAEKYQELRKFYRNLYKERVEAESKFLKVV
ncbi:MAG: hypothetical protein HYS25_01050 [Ignavibacteriales bacterium]|nr:hypothetical protein [Ignavibacteriales bacterium]